MRTFIFAVILGAAVSGSAQEQTLKIGQGTNLKIAFGSCGYQDHPQPVLAQAAAMNPDLFIYLGDNIYGDTDDMKVMRAKYAKLAANPNFQALKAKVPIVATWDDHDFGRNDAGRHYPFKNESKEIFLDFFGEPKGSVRRQRPGIYTSYTVQQAGKTLQIIVLDMRTFRDNLKPYKGEVKRDRRYFYDLDYAPYTADEQDSTLLGAAQWAWLEEQFRQPADLRLIASSTQFGIEFNGYEAWANFPHERKRMLDLIRRTRAEGVLFISGDVHYAELSRLDAPELYPIYDLTSSGLSSTWHFATPNAQRLEGPIMENHFGIIDLNWADADPSITLEIWDVRGTRRIQRVLRLSELRF